MFCGIALHCRAVQLQCNVVLQLQCSVVLQLQCTVVLQLQCTVVLQLQCTVVLQLQCTVVMQMQCTAMLQLQGSRAVYFSCQPDWPIHLLVASKLFFSLFLLWLLPILLLHHHSSYSFLFNFLCSSSVNFLSFDRFSFI